MELRAGWATGPGRVRGYNQDNLLVAPPVFVVADGMGGHAAGEVASLVAVDTIAAHLPPDASLTLDGVVAAVQAANRAIYDQSVADPTMRGMGTTLTGVAELAEGAIAVVNVGDSRTYLLRARVLSMLTRDHTYVDELVASGEITPEQARVHPHKHVITRALGIEPTTLVDTWTVVPMAGDRFLVCSDGLTNEVDDPTLAEILGAEADPQQAADTLARLANDFGGRDNITVLVVDVVAPDGTAPRAAARTSTTTAVPAMTGDEELVGDWLGDDVEPFATSPPPPPRRPADPADEQQVPEGATHRRGLTVAGVVFVLALVAVLGVAFLAIQSAGRRGHYVAFDAAGVVSVFAGQPDGVLWIDPTYQASCAITRDELSPVWVARVEARPTFSSQAAAQQWCVDLAKNPDAIPALTTTTTTIPPTTTTAPTTSIAMTRPATAAPLAPTTPATP